MALGLAGLLWAVAALALAIVACGRDTADPVTVTAVDELIRVGFLAQTEGGELAPAKGRPDLILEWNGKAKLRLMGESGYEYLDPLAIESDLVGEHPSEKLERLHRRFGVPMDKALARKLKDAQRSQLLFHSVEFEYLPGKQTTGMIAEVFPDGSFLVIPGQLPDEWMSDSRRTASPSHFLIDARGLISASFEIARAYEQEILALPFDDQREPPAHLAPKMCEFYREAVASQAYVELLSRIGFRPAAQGPDLGSASLADLASQITRARVGPHTTYFGSNGYWRADRMRSLGLDGLEDCDAARVARGLGGDIYVLLWRPSEPDRKQRHLVLRTDSSGGSPEAVYVAPGIPLAVLPLEHQDSVRLLLSTEGWPALTDDSPPDPRFQSVYMVDLASRETYEVIRYPLPFEDQNDHPGHLYGHSPFLTGDGRYLFTILYGFEGQGGGMWLADLTRDDFYQTPEAFSRLFPWDHALSWMLLSGPETLREGQSISVILTGKEVADDFAMTVNHLKIRFDGLRSSLVSKERLLRMVGWNPVPFAVQRLPDGESRVFIYTYFNYESSLLDRAKGVFIVSVKK